MERKPSRWDRAKGILKIIFAILAAPIISLLPEWRRELWIAEHLGKKDQEIAADRQNEATLQNYLDKMTDLLLKENLLEKKDNKDDPTVDDAQGRTVTTIRALDEKRRNILFQFLRDEKLTDFILAGASLNQADLSEADLSWVDLSEANLSGANLRAADLSWADLSKANLERAEVVGEQLDKTKSLKGATMPDGTKHE